MRTMVTAWLIAAFLAVLAIASGCEDSPMTAGKDFQMVLIANPSTVRIDPVDDPTPTSTLVATIVNATGVPQAGFLVFFSSNGGELASNTQGVETDSNGNAFDTLTVSALDPAEISVTATSTTLTQTVKVTKTDGCAANSAPTAAFTTSVPAPGATGEARQVSMSSTSSDTSPGVIQTYVWDCGNGLAGVGNQTAICDYVIGAVTKSYTITLTVTDNGLGGPGPTYACQKSATITHTVSIGVLASP